MYVFITLKTSFIEVYKSEKSYQNLHLLAIALAPVLDLPHKTSTVHGPENMSNLSIDFD